MGVDFWDVGQWKEQFAKREVLVMTYQILLNMLQAAIITVRFLPSNLVCMAACDPLHCI